MFFFFFQAEDGIRDWRDWSSDVCSSDLADERGLLRLLNPLGKLWLRGVARVLEYSTKIHGKQLNLSRIDDQLVVGGSIPRSEERRVGKECRSRWSPYH